MKSKSLFFKDLLLKSGAILSVIALGGGLLNCNSQDEEETIKDFNSISFEESSISLSVGENVTIDFETNIDFENLTYTLSNETIGSVTIFDGYVQFIASQSGTSILTLKDVEETASASFYIEVIEDQKEISYELAIDSSNAKKEYLLGEVFDDSGIEVYAYKTIDGVRQEVPFYVNDYSISCDGDEGFKELGIYRVDIDSPTFGSTFFNVEVKESIVSHELVLRTSNVTQRYTKGSIFTRSGLEVNEVETIKTKTSVDGSVVYSETSSTLSTSEYSINPTPNQVLDSNGWYDVEVTSLATGAKATYPIIVYENDDTFQDVAYRFVNTKNIGINVFTNIPTLTNPSGFYKEIRFKPNYYVSTSFKKENLLDHGSNREVESIEGGLKDKNNNLIRFNIDNDEVVFDSLVKTNATSTESYWDYTTYFNIGTFKEFVTSNFPVVTTSDEGSIAYQRVVPFEGGDDYETALGYYPLITSIFNVSQIDDYYFRFVEGYEIKVDENNNLVIRLDLKNYGYIEISTITQVDNVDNSIVVDAMKNQEFTFSTTIDPNVIRVKDALLSNNYIRGTSNGLLTYYYNENYVYYDYDLMQSPSLILNGISPFGLVKVTNSTKGFADGIYRISGEISGNNLIFNENNVSVQVLDTTQTAYTSFFEDYVHSALSSYNSMFGIEHSYISYALKDVLNDDVSMASFEVLNGTGNFYISYNADVASSWISYIGGSGNSSTLLSNGYILPAIVPSFDSSNRLDSLYLYSVDENLYGYGVSLSNFGDVNFQNINEYFGI